MEIQILKQEYKVALRKEVYLRAWMADFNGVSLWTLDRWRYDDNPMLTTVDNLNIIRKYLKLDANTVMTEAKEIEETAPAA